MQHLNLMKALSQIQDMCIDEIKMGYKLDAARIVELISDATEMSAPEFKEYLESFERFSIRQ